MRKALKRYAAAALVGTLLAVPAAFAKDYGKPGTPIKLTIGYQPYYTQAWSAVIQKEMELWKKYLPAGSTVEEGTVTVGPFQDPFAELVPRTSRGSRSASHDLAVDNRGNVRLNAEVEAADVDRHLQFDVKPPGVVVEPGMAQFAKVQVKPVKRFWRGSPKTRPFQLVVRSEGAPPVTLDGALL